MRKEYKHWSENDLAFIIYATYKGLSNIEIGSILDTSAQSISAKKGEIKNKLALSPNLKKKINKAEVLEFKIRSSEYPDHQNIWNEKITRVNGIKYAVTEKQVEPEPEKQEAIVEDELSELISLKINLSTLSKIIKVIRGI